MLGFLAIIILGFAPLYVAAQNATCLSGYDWAFNSEGQSPCEIATALGRVCLGANFTVAPLPPGAGSTYPGVPVNSDDCECSSVYYSLLSACAICQGGGVLKWSDYALYCGISPFLQIYPKAIPRGVGVPHYAYQNVTEGNGFDANIAQADSGPESTSGPTATKTSSSTSSSKKSSSTSTSKKSSTASATATDSSALQLLIPHGWLLLMIGALISFATTISILD